ncbi:hypothetical protein S245_067220, partial [Arachis hypogaea]
KKNKANNNKNNHHGANGEDTVLITPVPRFPDKSDDTAEMKICLSKVYKVEKVELSEDRMVAGSTKGYRMVRPTRGVVEGAWYFEIRVLHLGETGHTQLGWSTEKSDFAGTERTTVTSFWWRTASLVLVGRPVRTITSWTKLDDCNSFNQTQHFNKRLTDPQNRDWRDRNGKWVNMWSFGRYNTLQLGDEIVNFHPLPVYYEWYTQQYVYVQQFQALVYGQQEQFSVYKQQQGPAYEQQQPYTYETTTTSCNRTLHTTDGDSSQ